MRLSWMAGFSVVVGTGLVWAAACGGKVKVEEGGDGGGGGSLTTNATTGTGPGSTSSGNTTSSSSSTSGPGSTGVTSSSGMACDCAVACSAISGCDPLVDASECINACESGGFGNGTLACVCEGAMTTCAATLGCFPGGNGDPQPCFDCINDVGIFGCESLLDQCIQNFECENALNCMAQCNFSATCVGVCKAAHPGGEPQISNALDCIGCGPCAPECSNTGLGANCIAPG